MGEKIFSWAFIGSGRMANTAAGEILKSGRHSIAVVYSRNERSGQAFADRFKGIYTNSLEAALSKEGVDGVYVAVPQNVHFLYARRAIEAGKPVMVEKPFTVNANEAQELILLARERKVFLSEAMCMVYNPIMDEVLKAAGRLGKIESVDIRYAMATRYIIRLPRLMEASSAGGALMELGVYGVDFCNLLFDGEPEIIVESCKLKSGVDAGEKLILRYPDGAARLNISLESFAGLPRAIVNGERGRIEVPFFSAPKGFKAVIGGKAQKERLTEDGRYIFEFDEFAREVRDGREEPGKLKHGDIERTMRVMDGIRRKLGVRFPALEEDFS